MQEKPNKTKLKSLNLLAFIRPNWDFSMRYGESQQFFSDGRRTRPPCARVSRLAAIVMIALSTLILM
jgi:hypothetical protein